MAREKSVVKGVRLPKEIEEIIEMIADYEDRTVSKILARFIFVGLTEYIHSVVNTLENNLNTNKTDKNFSDFIDLLEGKFEKIVKDGDFSNKIKKWLREKEDKTPE